MQLGKFIKSRRNVRMFSESNRCDYETNFIVFERCVIYTIVASSSRLMYNGHFWLKDCQFERTTRKQSLLVKLCSNQRDVWLDTPGFVELLMQLQETFKEDECSAEVDVKFVEWRQILGKIYGHVLDPNISVSV